MKTHLAGLLCPLDNRSPSIFPLYLGVHIFQYTFYKVEIMAVTITVLNLAEKIYCSLFQVYVCHYSQTCIRRPLLGPFKSGRFGQVVV